MVEVQVISDFLYEKVDGVDDIESLKERLQEKIEIYGPPNLLLYNFIINGNAVYTHNTPLYDGDEVKILAREIHGD